MASTCSCFCRDINHKALVATSRVRKENRGEFWELYPPVIARTDFAIVGAIQEDMLALTVFPTARIMVDKAADSTYRKFSPGQRDHLRHYNSLSDKVIDQIEAAANAQYIDAQHYRNGPSAKKLQRELESLETTAAKLLKGLQSLDERLDQQLAFFDFRLLERKSRMVEDLTRFQAAVNKRLAMKGKAGRKPSDLGFVALSVALIFHDSALNIERYGGRFVNTCELVFTMLGESELVNEFETIFFRI